MRTCGGCGEEKSPADFYSSNSTCKSCRAAAARHWHERHREESRKRSAAYYKKSGGAAQRRYAEAHRAEKAEYARAYYQVHREKYLAYDRAKKASRSWKSIIEPIIEKVCAVCKIVKPLAQFSRNKQGAGGVDTTCKPCAMARLKAWQETHPEEAAELGREAVRRRRARIRYNVPVNDLTPAQWAMLKERYNFSCAYCGARVPVLTQDHVLALSKGGSHTMENVVPACPECNRKKSAKPVEQFLKEKNS